MSVPPPSEPGASSAADSRGRVPFSRAAFAVAGVVATGLLYVLISPDMATGLVRESGYFVLLVVFAAFGWAGLRLVRGRRFPSRRTWVACAVSVVLGTLVLHLHTDLNYRVAMDDYLLAATADSLHADREVAVLRQGRWINDVFFRFEAETDKRPWLYPFLVSVAHDFLGYATSHPFWTNALLGVVLLVLAFVQGALFRNPWGGALAVALWASLPLLSQNATGAGMDLSHLVLLQLVVLLGTFYLRAPSREREGLLSLGAILLAYSRYEALVFLPFVLAVIALGWWRVRRVLLSWFSVAAAPLLFWALCLHKFLSANRSMWELGTDTASRFGLENIGDNLGHALYFFFNFGDSLPNSLLIAVLGVPALLLFALEVRKSVAGDPWRHPGWTAAAVIGLGIVAHFVLVLSYHDGQLDELISARFSLPAYLLMVIAITAVAARLCAAERHWRWLLGVAGIFILTVTIPMNAKGIFNKRNFVVRENDWLAREASEHMPPHSLVIDRYTVPWLLRRRAALSPAKAANSAERLRNELADRKFAAIYLVRRSEMLPAGGEDAERAKSDLDRLFAKEALAERSFRPFHKVTLYRLRGRGGSGLLEGGGVPRVVRNREP